MPVGKRQLDKFSSVSSRVSSSPLHGTKAKGERCQAMPGSQECRALSCRSSGIGTERTEGEERFPTVYFK